MQGITSEMCLNAARKVFGTIPDIRNVTQGMIESGMSRVDTSHGIDMNQVPNALLEQMAESAAWFISDKDLRSNPEDLGPIEIRELIAAHLIATFPNLRQYAR